MNENERARYQARARIIKAMAHPTRLFLVDALSERSQCVAELTEQVGADMSTVSKHLAVLKNVGIVEDEKKGAQIFYRLKTPCVMNFFGCVETVMKSTATQQLKLVK